MDMPCTLEKVLRVGKGSRGANRTGAHYSARPRTNSGFRYTFWPRNKTKTNLVFIKVWKRVSTRYVRGQKSPKPSVGQKIRLQEDASVRLHVDRCAQTAVWTSSRMVSYFTFFEHWMPGNTGLRAESDGDAPDEVNFHSKVKKSIEETMWITASPWNIFKNVVLQSGSNVNGGVHRDMCLIGEFLPFIGEKYPNSGYLIRTEPTVAYYARDAVHFLEEAGLVTLKRMIPLRNYPRFAQ